MATLEMSPLSPARVAHRSRSWILLLSDLVHLDANVAVHQLLGDERRPQPEQLRRTAAHAASGPGQAPRWRRQAERHQLAADAAGDGGVIGAPRQADDDLRGVVAGVLGHG